MQEEFDAGQFVANHIQELTLIGAYVEDGVWRREATLQEAEYRHLSARFYICSGADTHEVLGTFHDFLQPTLSSRAASEFNEE